MQEVYERCRARFPTIDLPAGVYESHILEIMHADPGVKLEDLRHEDLFLALACSTGNRIAWEYFADEFAPQLRRIALRVCRSLSESDDLAQELISSLLENKTKLAGYSGRASLMTWLRVALSHAAIDRFRRARREVSLEEIGENNGEAHVPRATAREAEAEVRPDARWGPALVQILADEIRALAPRDRLFLSLYYLEGVPLKNIGLQFRIHEATVSRQLDALRRALRRGVEGVLRKRHRLTSKEIDSLWRWAEGEDSSMLREVLGSRLGVQGSKFNVQG